MVSALVVIISAVLLCGLVIPVSGVTIYTYGGQYYHQAYPLRQASTWVTTAQLTAGEAPTYSNPQALVYLVEHQLSRGWAFINVSDKATGVGNGSPCWFFAQQDQTYGYAYYLISEVYSYMANLSGYPTLFNNTVFQATFGVIFTLLGNVNNMLTINLAQTAGNGDSLESCIFQGDASWFAWFFGDIALIGIMTVATIVIYRRNRRNNERPSQRRRRY